MAILVHELIAESARLFPDRPAVEYQDEVCSYRELQRRVSAFAAALIRRGLKRGDRVAIYAEKRMETVVAMFGTARAGGVYVPVNPFLKGEQLSYILTDCGVRMLVTTAERWRGFALISSGCAQLEAVFIIGRAPAVDDRRKPRLIPWPVPQEGVPAPESHRVIDRDMAAILYTSGSTGGPKGVVLSHRNIVAGAQCVSEYLELSENDRLLCVLPLSFDYGMNQLTTMFLVGGSAVLMNHLFPRDILGLLEKEKITGLAAVPTLWIQLAALSWPSAIAEHLRFITNSGGPLPQEALRRLRAALPKTRPYLMYGLTESFRSTYLPPSEIDARPGSIGKAIPNEEIFVVRPDGSPCAPHEPGELVHRGALVSLGYWNDPARTAARFKPLPNREKALTIPEPAVWSGDTVKMDDDGYFYFIGREDEMIKTSGYRVSPTEIEELVYGTRLFEEAAAFGVPHPILGQAVALVVTSAKAEPADIDRLMSEFRERLPSYMVPARVEVVAGPLPRNPNGKIDRKLLAAGSLPAPQGSVP